MELEGIDWRNLDDILALLRAIVVLLPNHSSPCFQFFKRYVVNQELICSKVDVGSELIVLKMMSYLLSMTCSI